MSSHVSILSTGSSTAMEVVGGLSACFERQFFGILELGFPRLAFAQSRIDEIKRLY